MFWPVAFLIRARSAQILGNYAAHSHTHMGVSNKHTQTRTHTVLIVVVVARVLASCVFDTRTLSR